MLSDPDLFVAVRNNYLNVYYRGCSLARIGLESGAVVVDTHYKYLLKPRLKKEYVRALGGVFQLQSQWPNGFADPFTTVLSDIPALKAAAKPYAGEEKKFVGKVIGSHSNVVDVEIALTREAEEATETEPGKGASAKRIDIAALRWAASGPILDFYEAKLFANKEVRAEGDAKVVAQIATYEKLLSTFEGDIRAGFLRSCENVVALRGISTVRQDMARAALAHGDALTVNIKPFLIVGSFDIDQREGPVWKQHRAKLEGALGTPRVLLAGSATSVKLGRGVPPEEAKGA
ncbi:hypothetical protein GCM10011404_30550 [Sphingomonas prati]|nr:hypothetical protein GCM10011404_30550 [Sphingomonas prati]